jgi:hypothetical protein
VSHTLPVSLTTMIARGVHAGTIVQLRRVSDRFGTLNALAPGDRLCVREPWHVGKSFDEDKPTSLTRLGSQPIIVFAADLPKDADPAEIGLGRRRFARELPKAFHRAHLLVSEIRRAKLHDVSVEDSDLEAAVHRPDYPTWWDTYCSPEKRTISGTPSRWADNPPVIIIAFDLVRGPMS